MIASDFLTSLVQSVNLQRTARIHEFQAGGSTTRDPFVMIVTTSYSYPPLVAKCRQSRSNALPGVNSVRGGTRADVAAHVSSFIHQP